METPTLSPDGEPAIPSLTAELVEEGESYPIYKVQGGDYSIYEVLENGRSIGQIDVDFVSKDPGNEVAIISGLSPEEKLNNGYLQLASLAVAACIRKKHPNLLMFDIEDQPI